MSFWRNGARALKDRVNELEETESEFSDEVIALHKRCRHLETVLQDHREALAQAHSLISALEQDRERDRLASYKLAKAHLEAHGTALDQVDTTSALPCVDPAGADLRTKWFRSRKDALAYAANNGFQQAPVRRRVWLDLAWSDEWSLRVPAAEEVAA